MPTISVNNLTLAYEILGSGPVVVWTPGGWFPRENWVYLNAGCLADSYCVLLWDRRNSGASDVAIEDAPSEFQLWTDDLHHLLKALNLSPAYLAGGSAGSLFSLLMAHRYPADVKGLILIDTPANELDIIKPIFDAHYLQLAEIAESKDMAAVIAHSTDAWVRMASAKAKPDDWLLNWVAGMITMNPANHARLLAIEPRQFARIMKKWGDLCEKWILAKRFHVCGLSDEEVRQITAPTLVIHGFDPVHPRLEAEAVYQLLPNAEWLEFSDHYSREMLERMVASDGLWHEKSILSMPLIKAFLQRVEAK